jgi:hypothetical protein
MGQFGKEITVLGNRMDNLHPKLHPACQSAGTLGPMLHDTQKGRILIVNSLGAECERRGFRVRLGGSSYPISAMSDVHHCYS